MHFCVKGSIVIWTRLSREMTNLSKHHSLCSWVGSGVPWPGRVIWAHWALGEFADPRCPVQCDGLGMDKGISPLIYKQLWFSTYRAESCETEVQYLSTKTIRITYCCSLPGECLSLAWLPQPSQSPTSPRRNMLSSESQELCCWLQGKSFKH